MNITGKFKGSGQEDIVTLTFELMVELENAFVRFALILFNVKLFSHDLKFRKKIIQLSI